MSLKLKGGDLNDHCFATTDVASKMARLLFYFKENEREELEADAGDLKMANEKITKAIIKINIRPERRPDIKILIQFYL